MSRSGLRVVFDTNTFTPDHFELLANGPLVQFCQTGRIGPVYGVASPDVVKKLSGKGGPLRGSSVRPVGLELRGFNQTEELNR